MLGLLEPLTSAMGTTAGDVAFRAAAEAGQMIEFRETTWPVAIISSILALAGAVFVFTSARAMYLAPDALSQINMIGPAAGVGLPLLILANLVYSWGEVGFQWSDFIRAIEAIVLLLVVQSVGAYIMGRALHATHWDHTAPLSGGQRAKEPR